MAMSSAVSGNSRFRLGHAERVRHPRSKTSDLDQKCFEFDRKIVAGVLGALQAAINRGATQMEMVADERMFDQPLSGAFARSAQHLDQMAHRLQNLVDEVADATGYPKLAAARAVIRRLPARQV